MFTVMLIFGAFALLGIGFVVGWVTCDAAEVYRDDSDPDDQSDRLDTYS